MFLGKGSYENWGKNISGVVGLVSSVDRSIWVYRESTRSYYDFYGY